MNTYPSDRVTFVRGLGTELWDDAGTRYLDFLGGLAVVALGHANPEIADAIEHQARTLVHVSNLFATERGEEAASKIDRLLGGGGQVFFSNSGAESNECAIKLARKWGGRGRYQVVSAYNSFHGRTLATLHATGQPSKHEAFQPLPEGFRHVPLNDIDELARALDPSVAAVLLEPVQGEGGVYPAEVDYLKAVRALCDERGVLLIMDEVQTGLGRTGHWFGFEAAGIAPDIVTLAKALGNGFPVGACWARREVAAAFEPGDHGTTYGGQPLAASVVCTVIDIMVREDIPARSRAAGALLAAQLEALAQVDTVRGTGLLLGAELTAGIDARVAAARALERGLVINGVTPTALRLAPPLLVSEAEIGDAVAIIGEVLAELDAEGATSDRAEASP